MRKWFEEAHPFFWLAWAGAITAGGAAFAAEARRPGYALHSLWIYRLEVGLAFFVGVYFLGLILWLAYQGRSVQQAHLPGGPGISLPSPGLDAAATAFEDYRADVDAQLERHEENVDQLEARLRRLENRDEA